MTTQAQGCFTIEETGSASPLIPNLGGCQWPATSGSDTSRGKQTFLSTASSAVKVTADGFVDSPNPNYTLSTTSLNPFTLVPKNVPLGTVNPALNPADPAFDWSSVAFTAVPAAGPTNAITVRATGTGTGTLAWTDSRLGSTPDVVTPGTYRITATRSGYLPATGTLKCPIAVNSTVTCAWDPSDVLTLEKLSSLDVTAKDGAAVVPNATYVLTGGGATQTQTGGAGGVVFDGLDPNEDDYRISVRAAGYDFGVSDPLDITCGSDDSIVLEPGATTQCDVAMRKLGTISGTVSGIAAPPPATSPVADLAGATVRIRQCSNVNTAGDCTAVVGGTFTGSTQADGTFSITGTAVLEGLDPTKSWLVTATSPGYSLPDAAGSALDGVVVRSADFAGGEATADVTMYLDPVDVSVVLLDGSGTPYPRAASVQLLRITSTSTEVVQTAVQSGTSYNLTDIVPGAYIVSVSGGGLQAATQSTTITTNGQVISMSVARAANVAHGTITANDPPGTALQGATVSLCSTLACTTTATGTDNLAMTIATDASGNFQVRTVPDDDFYVKVAKAGYTTQVQGPYTFNHVLGAVLPINTQMVAVTRQVKITLDPKWANDDLSASTVTLTGGYGSPQSPTGVLTSDSSGGWVATFAQVHWGCWKVAVVLPTGHHGTVSNPASVAPTDSSQTCASDEVVVSSAQTTTNTTATMNVDEGRLDIRTKTTVDATFGHTAPTATVVSLRHGTDPPYLDDAALTAGSTMTIWLPTGVQYDLAADLATPDAFWSDDSDSVTLNGTGNGTSPKLVELELKELHATLVVNVSGFGNGQASLSVTAPSGESVPTGVPTMTTGGSATFKLPAGSWKITATRSGQSIEGTRSITSPTGSYTLNLVVPAPAATGATAGKPGSFTPSGAVTPANLAALSGVTASPATAWTEDQYVALADGSNAYWNGTTWKAGKAPA